ncbi:MAG: heavy-metal-associated domain-containing protein [Bdellovibrionaceae bacterium]|nr:heavy-metal-associated domain-containing protein [Pseudobdellovibrionaceae bacterium]MBX3035182.1 heavy-metal-associated domain-containing protein [Pseudobdellovibrionaceae bacterium]
MRVLSLIMTLSLTLPAWAETKVYQVEGMTCGSCVKAIKAQVCQLPGLESCQVELNKVTITAPAVNDDVVKSAIAKAGEYSVSKVEGVDPTATKSSSLPGVDHKKKTTPIKTH